MRIGELSVWSDPVRRFTAGRLAIAGLWYAARSAALAARMSRRVDAVLPALETADDAKLVLALSEERQRIATRAQTPRRPDAQRQRKLM